MTVLLSVEEGSRLPNAGREDNKVRLKQNVVSIDPEFLNTLKDFV